MKSFTKKVAYLHGLSKGLDVRETTAEGKVLIGILDALDTCADELEELYSAHRDLEDYIETMDEDLSKVEDTIFEDIEQDDIVEVKCPYCHSTIHFTATDLDDSDEVEVTCPECGKIMYYNTELLDQFDDRHYADSDRPIHAQQPGI